MRDFEFIARACACQSKSQACSLQHIALEFVSEIVRCSSKFMEELLEMKPGKRAQVCLLS